MFNKIYENCKHFIINNYKFILIWLVAILLCLIELPYVVYKPGGAINTNSRIVIDTNKKIDGSFSMSYVSVLNGNIPNILLSYLIPNWDLYKISDITYDNETMADLEKEEKLQMDESITNAVFVAYHKANKEVKITSSKKTIIYIDANAKTDLQLFDQIISVDGINLDETTDINTLLKDKKIGDTVKINVKRDNELRETTSQLIELYDEAKVGIMYITNYEYETDPKVNFKTKNSEMGSSGGLMISLAIYNNLIDDDITHGKKIYGTGTISEDGIVGEIDGVKYKLLGASKDNAELFICPIENYNEAIEVKNKYHLDIEIKGVHTFDEALNYLNNLA